jgi:hypothetical protein
VWRYYGYNRKFFQGERALPVDLAPVYRVVHHVWFEEDEEETEVFHTDFVRHPEFKKLFPEQRQQRRLNYLNH